MENNNWLILGGVGYIGRNLVRHLLEEHLASHVTVADKSLPAFSFFHPVFEGVFSSIEMIQVDLSRNPAKVFNKEYRYIVNLTGETRAGLPESRYRQNSVGVVQACKPFIAASKWIEISSALVYKSNKKGAIETDPYEPWTLEGRFRLESERVLEGTNHVILRPSRVYGNGDFTTVTPRVILGAVYLRLKAKLKLLWGDDLRIATIHVKDLCRSIFHLKDAEGVFNVSDNGDTKQANFAEIVQSLFGIKTEYYSRILSNMASLQGVAEEANEIHMKPWAEICSENGVDSPIYPYVEQENLEGSHLAVNNEKLIRSEFQLEYPVLTLESVRESLRFLTEAQVLPSIFN
jgi:nucleoside-diphosphate-sugar epimerase